MLVVFVIVTTTLPIVAPDGTGTTMLVADQLVGVAVVSLNVTVLLPFLALASGPPSAACHRDAACAEFTAMRSLLADLKSTRSNLPSQSHA